MTLKLLRIPKVETAFPWRGIFVVLGGTLMLMSVSIDFSFGNLNTYVTSYLRSRNSNIGYEDWIFISQTKSLVGGFVAPFSGKIASKFGIKVCLIAACIIFTGGYFLTFFALDLGLWACVISISVAHGIGYGLSYPVCVSTPLHWFPLSWRGFFGSIAVAGYGFGSVVWNPLETAYVNPNNVAVENVPDSDDLYFVDEDVLNRVPYLFLVIGGCFLAFQIPAVLLVREPDANEQHEIHELETSKDREILLRSVQRFSVKPRQALQQTNFWKLYASFFALTMIAIVISNYQKAFGQTFIQDDAYFAVVATIQNVCNGFCRIFWGFVYDRKGVKFTLIIITCISTAVAFAMGDLGLLEPNSTGAKAFYACSVIILFSFCPGSFSCYPAAVYETFGPRYCTTNYGVMFTAMIIFSLLLILITQTVFDIVGYGGLFLICGAFGAMGLVAMLIFPENITSEFYREKLEEKTKDVEQNDEAVKVAS